LDNSPFLYLISFLVHLFIWTIIEKLYEMYFDPLFSQLPNEACYFWGWRYIWWLCIWTLVLFFENTIYIIYIEKFSTEKKWNALPYNITWSGIHLEPKW
jgi:hypothetical protein